MSSNTRLRNRERVQVVELVLLGDRHINGSRRFIFMEGCLDIIYHVRPECKL